MQLAWRAAPFARVESGAAPRNHVAPHTAQLLDDLFAIIRQPS
jgi:hypothetical protein